MGKEHREELNKRHSHLIAVEDPVATLGEATLLRRPPPAELRQRQNLLPMHLASPAVSAKS